MPDLTTILGDANIQKKGVRRVFDPTRGIVTETVFQGTVAAVEAAEASLIGFGIYREADYTDPPLATLTIRTPDAGDGTKPADGILSTTYDLDGNQTGKSIFEHPTLANLSDVEVDSIRAAYSSNTNQATVTIIGTGLGDGADGVRSTYRGPQTEQGKRFLSLMKKGHDSFIVGQFVFKVTHIIANDSEINVAYSNTSNIYSNDALLTETDPTTLYRTGIANAYATVLRDYYSGVIPDRYVLGWLKNPPAINNVAGNRSAVVVQYWLEAWSNDIYGTVI